MLCCQTKPWLSGPSFLLLKVFRRKARYAKCMPLRRGYGPDFHGQGKSLAGRDTPFSLAISIVSRHTLLPRVKERHDLYSMRSPSNMVPPRHTWIPWPWPSHARCLANFPLFTGYCMKGNSFFIHFTVLASLTLAIRSPIAFGIETESSALQYSVCFWWLVSVSQGLAN